MDGFLSRAREPTCFTLKMPSSHSDLFCFHYWKFSFHFVLCRPRKLFRKIVCKRFNWIATPQCATIFKLKYWSISLKVCVCQQKLRRREKIIENQSKWAGKCDQIMKWTNKQMNGKQRIESTAPAANTMSHSRSVMCTRYVRWARIPLLLIYSQILYLISNSAVNNVIDVWTHVEIAWLWNKCD